MLCIRASIHKAIDDNDTSTQFTMLCCVCWQNFLTTFSGRIAWARQLHRRLKQSMDVFQQQPDLLKGYDAKRIIRKYNKVSLVLVKFEVLYYKAYNEQVKFALWLILPELAPLIDAFAAPWMLYN